MGEARRTARVGRLTAAAVPALYALITIVLTYPLAFRIARKLPRHDSDIWIFLWNDWWLREAIARGSSLFRTPYLFHPSGVSLAFHSNSPLPSMLDAAMFPVLGAVAAYNISTLLIFIVGAWGMFLLAREMTGSWGASFVAGLVYAFAPYHFSQALAHPHLAHVQWYPFMILFLRRAMLQGSAPAGAIAGVFFALSVSSGLHLGTLGGILAAAFVAFTLASESAARTPGSLKALVASAIVAIALASPALLTPLRELRAAEGGVEAVRVEHEESFQTDAAAFFVPSPYHPVFSRFVAPVYALFERNSKWFPYLGFVPLALAVYAAIRGGRAARFWWVSGLLWIVLALGTHLRFAGVLYPSIRLPFALLVPHVPFSLLRSSDRFNLLVPLSLAMLVAMALARVRARGAVRIAASLILFEYLQAPIPTGRPLEASPFLTRMAEDHAAYAIVDLPMGYELSKRWLYLQTLHHKPMVEGHVSRVPPHAYDFIDGIPLLRALAARGGPPPADPAADLCRMAENGIRYILIHTEYATAGDISLWTSWLPGQPFYRDGTLIVYTTDGACETTAIVRGRTPAARGVSGG